MRFGFFWPKAKHNRHARGSGRKIQVTRKLFDFCLSSCTDRPFSADLEWRQLWAGVCPRVGCLALTLTSGRASLPMTGQTWPETPNRSASGHECAALVALAWALAPTAATAATPAFTSKHQGGEGAGAGLAHVALGSKADARQVGVASLWPPARPHLRRVSARVTCNAVDGHSGRARQARDKRQVVRLPRLSCRAARLRGVPRVRRGVSAVCGSAGGQAPGVGGRGAAGGQATKPWATSKRGEVWCGTERKVGRLGLLCPNWSAGSFVHAARRDVGSGVACPERFVELASTHFLCTACAGRSSRDVSGIGCGFYARVWTACARAWS